MKINGVEFQIMDDEPVIPFIVEGYVVAEDAAEPEILEYIQTMIWAAHATEAANTFDKMYITDETETYKVCPAGEHRK